VAATGAGGDVLQLRVAILVIGVSWGFQHCHKRHAMDWQILMLSGCMYSTQCLLKNEAILVVHSCAGNDPDIAARRKIEAPPVN
jgi:hypothetical protein